jgi:magnesium transporter
VASGAAAGASTGGVSTNEVHFILAAHFVVTVHHGECPAMDQARQRISHHRPAGLELPQIALIYLIIDQLVDSFFPMLDAFDGQIDDLEDAILAAPTEAQLGTLFTMKRSLITVRKVITPQRDMFASITSGVVELPGITADGQRYLRDIYDHLIRISDLVDGYRDLLSGVMDTHLSTVSNRLNVVMKQLTIIATVFLPLSFLTGFFGQNFSWLVGHIMGVGPFLIFGIGIELASAAGLLYVFRKRGWFGGPTT